MTEAERENVLRRMAPKFRVMPSGCWEWTAGMSDTGYGEISFRGGPMSAPRVSYMARVGEIPKGLFVCHRCDNKKCINPDHLFLGTCRENILDAAAKGRLPRGERRPGSKLSAATVTVIRTLADRGASQADLARRFKISAGLVCGVVSRKLWRHVA